MPDKEAMGPLKDKPLQAGRSPKQELDRFMNEKFTCFFMVSALILIVAASEWYRWFFNIPFRPLLATFTSLIVLFYCLPKIIKMKKQVESLRLARDSEKVVGESLEHLRREGYIVFHDIAGDKYNLNYVILSTKGIYAVETKTYARPAGRAAKVQYDGDHLHIEGLGSKDEILLQTKADSMWLKGILRDSTGREYTIKPVVVFPGWEIESKTHDKTWVLNPKALPQFIQNQDDVLSREDVKLAAYHLSRYIRTS